MRISLYAAWTRTFERGWNGCGGLGLYGLPKHGSVLKQGTLPAGFSCQNLKLLNMIALAAGIGEPCRLPLLHDLALHRRIKAIIAQCHIQDSQTALSETLELLARRVGL